MKIEVEVRSFLTKEEYETLDHFFQTKANFLGEDIQETYYLKAPLDLRVQKNRSGTKIWAKAGELHTSARQEFELFCQKSDFQPALALFKNLGHEPYIIWWRKRRQYTWRTISVSLDHTRNYGYILELEKTVTRHPEKSLIKLTALMAELNIAPTPKAAFDGRYKSYVEKYQLKK